MNNLIQKQPFPEVFPYAKWTVIILINGENDLMKEVEQAYDQLANVGSCFGDVNFVVIFDGLTINEELGVMHRSCTNDKAYPNVYYVTKCRNLTTTAQPYRSYPLKENLAGVGNLRDILSEVIDSFPADHFGFIFKGHGGAGRTDITSDIFRVDKVRKYTGESDDHLFDRLIERAGKQWHVDDDSYYQLSNDSDVVLAIYKMTDREGYCELTYARLRDELESAGFRGDRKLSFLCLDCCWGQILENAEIFKNTTSYFIGSADEMPVMGIGYEEFADFLVRNRDIRPDEIANGIVAVFFKNNYNDYQSSPKWANIGVSLTCVDMAKYQKVAPMMESLTKYLTANVEPLYLIISMARRVCMEYTNDLNPSDYGIYNVDLIWFLENLRYFNDEIGKHHRSRNYADLDNMITAVYQAIYGDFLSSHMASNYRSYAYGKPHIGGNGIAITFPKDETQFRNSLYGRPNTRDLKIDVWEEFLNAFIETQKKLGTLSEEKVLWCHKEYLRIFYEIPDQQVAEQVAASFMVELKASPEVKWVKKQGTSSPTGMPGFIDRVIAAGLSIPISSGNGNGNGKAPSGVKEDKKTGIKVGDWEENLKLLGKKKTSVRMRK